MRPPSPTAKHRLPIQTGGLFACPYEWAITDFVYWKSNTQKNRQWTCRLRFIQQYTPAKRLETISDALDRLCERKLGFSKTPFGKPQRRRCGDGLTTEPVQSYQYVFDAKQFDTWLKAQPSIPPIRKRIDPYTEADRPLSENGQQTYPKADTTIMNKKEEKKEVQEVFGSQTPSTAASAPEPPRNLGDEFERFFHDRSPPPSTSAAALQPEMSPAERWDMLMKDVERAAEGGVSVGSPSTSVASPSTSIQPACGNRNGDGSKETGELRPVGSQTPSTAAAAPELLRKLDEEFESFFVSKPAASTRSGVPDGGLGCPGAAVIQPSADGNPNAAAPPGCMDQPGASAERPAGDCKPNPFQSDLNSTTQG